jgi:hypothetical protein
LQTLHSLVNILHTHPVDAKATFLEQNRLEFYVYETCCSLLNSESSFVTNFFFTVSPSFKSWINF